MEKIKQLLKKFLTKEILFYIIFGVITTLINLLSFWLMNSVFNWNENLANAIAIVIAVIFAYFANKDLVFHSDASNFKEKIVQFFKFILGRAFTMVVEWGGGFLLFKLPIPNIVVKLFLTVLVIILNFFISKFFAFRKKKDEKDKDKDE